MEGWLLEAFEDL